LPGKASKKYIDTVSVTDYNIDTDIVSE